VAERSGGYGQGEAAGDRGQVEHGRGGERIAPAGPEPSSTPDGERDLPDAADQKEPPRQAERVGAHREGREERRDRNEPHVAAQHGMAPLGERRLARPRPLGGVE
jgi:hypothetical protein